MDLTILSDNLTLSSAWQFADLGNINVIKITALNNPNIANNLSIFGRYEIGQFNAAKEGFNFRAIRLEDRACFFELNKPEFFEEQSLGIRLAPDFAPFTLKIEGFTMPVSNSQPRSEKVITNQIIVPLSVDVSKKILPANDKRKSLYIRNKTNGTIAIEAADAIDFAQKNYFAYIPAGEFYETGLDFTGEVWAKGEAGVVGNLDIRESILA